MKFPQLKTLPTQEEVDELRAQIEQYKIALAERKAVCHKAFDANDAQAAKIEELTAQVEQFRGLLIRVAKSDEYIIDNDLATAVCSDLVSEISEAIEKSEAQCLAEIEAQAVEAAADYAAGLISDKYGIANSGAALEILNHKTDVILCVAEYANQLRKAVKDGE